MAFRGLQCAAHNPTNAMCLRVRLAGPKAHHLAESILGFLANRTMPHAALESPIGRLNYAHPTTRNRFARGMLKQRYAKLYAKPYCNTLRPIIRRTLRRWRATLIDFARRISVNSLRFLISFFLRTRPSWITRPGHLRHRFDRVAPL